MGERLHPPLPSKNDLEITKNYKSIILTAVAAKVYNSSFLIVSDTRSRLF